MIGNLFPFDPLGQPTVKAGSDYCFDTCCPYVRVCTYVCPQARPRSVRDRARDKNVSFILLGGGSNPPKNPCLEKIAKLSRERDHT